MKKSIALLPVVLSFLVFPAAAQTILPPASTQYENTVEVTGKAEKEIVPDEIFIRITISESESKTKSSVEKMEQDMISKLKSLGIDTDNDLKIGDMSSKYRTQIFGKSRPGTTATYQLRVDGAMTLGKVYQAMESIGISNMSIIKLSHSRLDDYVDELRTEAMLNARKNARTLAEAVGQSIGRAVYIADHNHNLLNAQNIVMQSQMMYKAAAATDEYYESDLGFRNIRLSYSITAKFLLE